MGDAKFNVGSNALSDALTVVALCKIGVNSIADITNGIYSYIVKANANTGHCIYRPPQFEIIIKDSGTGVQGLRKHLYLISRILDN